MKGQKSNIFYSSNPQTCQSAELGHELGNVLNGLLGMAELLGSTGLSPEQEQWLEGIVHSGRQMQALIQSEWNALRGHVPRPAPSPELVDGVRLLERVLVSHLPAARTGNNCVHLNIHADVPRYWDCDPCMVRQLLDNVLGNALKFTSDGDVVLEVLAITLQGKVLFRVSDTGPGFEPKPCHPPGVSEQVKLANRGAGPGNQGFGLPVCHRIIEALGGEFSITSAGKTGTRVEFSLPQLINPQVDFVHLDCSFFRFIQCRLCRLADPLLPGVQNALDRLGVEWSSGDPVRPGDQLIIEVSERFRGPGRGDRELLLRPVTREMPATESRNLALPLLESSLGSLLAEMALTWRTQAFKSDGSGSVHAQRRSTQTGARGRRRG